MTNSALKRRSSDAQLQAMKLHWPAFDGSKSGDGMLRWNGPLKPKARLYHVAILWKPGAMALPYVWLYDPALQPRAGSSFADIPHLIFYKEDPEHSGLCLFDPERREWSPADLIAETTVPWASEWLLYYELWHLTGEWFAPGVGRERVAQMPPGESGVIKDLLADVH